MDWWVIHGAQARQLMATHHDELRRAWQDFSAAGSADAARQVVRRLPSGSRMLLTILTVRLVCGELQDQLPGVVEFEARIPVWLAELLA